VGVLGRDLPGAGDAGVVDQYVEVAEAFLDLLRGLVDGGLVGDVQGDRVRVAACRAQCCGCLLAALRVSGADQDRHAQGSQLFGCAAADSLVGSSDQGDLLMLAHTQLLAMEDVFLSDPQTR
jgi:hypothetical protein